MMIARTLRRIADKLDAPNRSESDCPGIVNAKDLSPDQQFAFAAFLKQEALRHKKDIDNAMRDLEALRDLGVDVDKARPLGFVICGELVE